MSCQFRGARVIITGGLGFIGSNLACRLVSEGADVTLLDSLVPEYGGSLLNIRGWKTGSASISATCATCTACAGS